MGHKHQRKPLRVRWRKGRPSMRGVDDRQTRNMLRLLGVLTPLPRRKALGAKGLPALERSGPVVLLVRIFRRERDVSARKTYAAETRGDANAERQKRELLPSRAYPKKIDLLCQGGRPGAGFLRKGKRPVVAFRRPEFRGCWVARRSKRSDRHGGCCSPYVFRRAGKKGKQPLSNQSS